MPFMEVRASERVTNMHNGLEKFYTVKIAIAFDHIIKNILVENTIFVSRFT